MRRPRLMVPRRFRPITRVLGAIPATRRPPRFRPLAMIFRLARTRPAAPPPTVVARDGARITIAPRLHLHLHLHRHLHPHGQQPSSDRSQTATVFDRRAIGLPSGTRTQALRMVLLTTLASQARGAVERVLACVIRPYRHRSKSRAVSPAASVAIGGIVHRDPNLRRPMPLGWPKAVGPSAQTEGAAASVRSVQGRPLVIASLSGGRRAWAAQLLRGAARAARPPSAARAAVLITALIAPASHALEERTRAAATKLDEFGGTRRAAGRWRGSAPRPGRDGLSKTMPGRPDRERGRATPLPALTSVSPFASALNRTLLGLYLPWTTDRRNSSVVPDHAIGRGKDQRPVAPAAIEFRRAADVRAQPVAPPQGRAASAPPPVRIDIDRISDEVIRRIERRSRIERERRGLL